MTPEGGYNIYLNKRQIKKSAYIYYVQSHSVVLSLRFVLVVHKALPDKGSLFDSLHAQNM
jgi:hypothetical protein